MELRLTMKLDKMLEIGGYVQLYLLAFFSYAQDFFLGGDQWTVSMTIVTSGYKNTYSIQL